MFWTRAIHLAHWADTQDARHTLPLLVRRLIRRTVPALTALNFPAGEEVQRPGFDGIVEAREGNEFVPAGVSRWEMGVDKDVKGKAEDDFEKRTAAVPAEERQHAVFVFVTPRAWQKKEYWAQEKAAKSGWRGVVALDANDLEHWLEIAPGVDIWFTGLSGRVADGVQSLQPYWQAVSRIAEYPLVPTVFTTSRDPEIAAVRKWLAGAHDSLLMKTHGLTDGLDFLAALGAADEDDRIRNAVIVHTNQAWRDLVVSREPLLLVAAPTLALSATEVSAAVSGGHHVFVSGPRGAAAHAEAETLGRQDHYSVAQALQACGFPEARALSLGTGCCGSSSILKRLITRHPETRFPAWSHDDVRATVAPFALVGGWVHVDPEPPADRKGMGFGSPPPLDVWVVTELVGCTKDQLEGIVARWQRDSEPLFLRLGASVLVASREDAWHLLGGAVTETQRKRFRDLALLVLDEDNPAFELEPEQRWLASLYGKTHSLSDELRRSIIETLALMTTYPTADRPDAGVDFGATVRWVLERAIPRNASWQRWASFGQNLMVLAEADPDFFLSRAEDDLNSDEPELPKLFQDQSHSVFSSAIHSSLLWALEGLAWSPDYLARVAVILAKLAAHDPGGACSNRPRATLRELFFLWLWHTNAPLDERIRALSRVAEAEPDVGWRLFTDILPSGTTGFSQTTHMPRWRTWPEGWSREKLQSQVVEYALAVANLVLRLAGSDPRRWAQVLDGMLRFSPEVRERVFGALEGIADSPERDEDGVFALWDVLRNLAARHERFAEAGWAFPQEVRERMSSIRDRLQPADPVRRHYWLFAHHLDLPGIDPLQDTKAYYEGLHAAQLTALRQIIAETGIDGVSRLLRLAPAPSSVGWLIGQERLLAPQDLGLPEALGANDMPRLACVQSYVSARHAHEGWNFVKELPVVTWSAQQIATFARCLPFSRDVWTWLAAYGSDVEVEYWQNARGFLREADLEQVGIACRALLRVGRPFTAIEILVSVGYQKEKIQLPSDLVAETLEAAYAPENAEGVSMAHNVQYGVQHLLLLLQKNMAFDRGRLARIEWGLLPMLDREWSEVGPDTLVGEVLSNPESFVHLLTLVYRGENDPPREEPSSEQDQIRARFARTLLGALRRLPGTDEKGQVDCEYLRRWAEGVRAGAMEVDRLTICDHTVGQLFARGCKQASGDWPAPDVARVMEDVGTDSFFDGFANGIYNSRGVVSRRPCDGGELERSLAGRYRELAAHARPSGPKLAEAFLRLADHYDADARREDEEAERRKLGR